MFFRPSASRSLALAGVALLVLPPAAALAADATTAVSDASRRGHAPDVAVGADGDIHVIWLDKGTLGTADKRGSYATGDGGHSHQSFTNLYYSRSGDGGATFSAPVQVNATDGEVWGFAISKPQVAVGRNGIVHVYYPANAKSPTTGKDVASSYYTRSLDGGRTFPQAVSLNSDPADDLSEIVSGGLAQAQVFGSMTVDGAGNVYSFWLDTRDMNADDMLSSVYLRASADDGENFGAERELFATDSCPCCQVTSTAGDDDEVFVASRLVSGDHIRMPAVARSADGGSTFGSRAAVAGPAWRIEGCPLKPTAMAASGDVLHTLVFNGAAEPAGLLYSRSTDRGASFAGAVPIHPDAATSNNPVLVSAGDRVAALWHAKVDGGRQVYLRTSDDGGENFGAVRALTRGDTTNAYPAAAAAGDGELVVVWQHGEQIHARRVAW